MTEGHLNTLLLHRYRYGELGPEEQRDLQAHLEACAACAGRLVAQEDHRLAFEREPIPDAIRHAGRPVSPSRRWLRWAVAPAIALAALLLLFVRPPQGELGEGTRTKGLGDPVEVLVEGDGLLAADGRVAAGARVQVRVAPGPWTRAWVGDGQKLLGSFEVGAEGPTLAPFSLALDRLPGDEALVVVLADRPMSDEQAIAAMRGNRMDGVRVSSKTLHKVP